MEQAKAAVTALVSVIGVPQSELTGRWLRYLLVWNGLFHIRQLITETRDRHLFKTKKGERKVASFAEMNAKYVGFYRTVLFVHIVTGSVVVLGASAAVGLEEYHPTFSSRAALVSSATEAFLHGPTALVLSPIVYGDKGVTPFVYFVTSFLLILSGLSALVETTAMPSALLAGGVRPELRRMASTVSIFLYVRLYAIIRGASGFLRKQKYTAAVMTAGLAMLPVGWNGMLTSGCFWLLFVLNIRTVKETVDLVHEFGIDGAAERQSKLA